MLGNKVRAAMEEAKITNGQLAKLLGVTPQNVHKYKQANDLRWSTIVKICAALDIEIEEFIKY